MKTIFKNGKIQDVPFFLNENDEFGIQELDDLRAPDRIAYQGDGIKYELDNELVGLCDLFRDLLFEDVDRQRFYAYGNGIFARFRHGDIF